MSDLNPIPFTDESQDNRDWQKEIEKLEGYLAIAELARLVYGEDDLGTRCMVYGGEVIEF
jgi:hypothetical protein